VKLPRLVQAAIGVEECSPTQRDKGIVDIVRINVVGVFGGAPCAVGYDDPTLRVTFSCLAGLLNRVKLARRLCGLSFLFRLRGCGRLCLNPRGRRKRPDDRRRARGLLRENRGAVDAGLSKSLKDGIFDPGKGRDAADMEKEAFDGQGATRLVDVAEVPDVSRERREAKLGSSLVVIGQDGLPLVAAEPASQSFAQARNTAVEGVGVH